MEFSATITSIIPKTYTKANGKQYLLMQCLCTSGKLDGVTVLAQRTIGADKKTLSVGDEVVLYHSLSPTGAHFFEVSGKSMEFEQAASQDLLNQLLGDPIVASAPTAPTLDAQVV